MRRQPDPAYEDGHTCDEITALTALLTSSRPRIESITIGGGRTPSARAGAEAMARRWQTMGGHVLDVVDWPEDAASWLRQARRFTRETPDAWVVTGPAAGWERMSRRLRLSTDWDPARTFVAGALADGRTWTAAPAEKGWL